MVGLQVLSVCGVLGFLCVRAGVLLLCECSMDGVYTMRIAKDYAIELNSWCRVSCVFFAVAIFR